MPDQVVFSLQASEVFSWINPDTNEMLHFDVGPMRHYAESGGAGSEKVRFEITPDVVQGCINGRGVEMDKVHAMMDDLRARFDADGTLDPTKEKHLQPMIGVLFPNDKTVTVDGNHRLVMWSMFNMPDGLMWLFTYEAAQRFLIEPDAWCKEQIRKEMGK